MNIFLENIKNELDLVSKFGRKFNYELSEFENRFFINKIHNCGIPEAIYSGTHDECIFYINQLYEQNTLFQDLFGE